MTRRVLLVAVIAALAVVPLRAFGVVGGSEAAGLSVTASLAGCGVAGDGIVCEIQVSYGGVEDADYYTASVTRADGSVQDLGSIGGGEDGGGASVWVPYVGAGTYSVTVSAWGTPEEDEAEKPELLERDRAKAGGKDSGKPSYEPGATEEEGAPAVEGQPAGGAAEPQPAEPAPADPAPQPLPKCQAEADAAEAESATDGTEPEVSPAPAEPPPAPIVECTTASSDANGPCCPPGA